MSRWINFIQSYFCPPSILCPLASDSVAQEADFMDCYYPGFLATWLPVGFIQCGGNTEFVGKKEREMGFFFLAPSPVSHQGSDSGCAPPSSALLGFRKPRPVCSRGGGGGNASLWVPQHRLLFPSALVVFNHNQR